MSVAPEADFAGTVGEREGFLGGNLSETFVMKSLLVLSTLASLAIAAPTLSQAAVKHAHHPKMSGTTSTTPAVTRPGDADVRSANQKGGVGGKNSSSNGS